MQKLFRLGYSIYKEKYIGYISKTIICIGLYMSLISVFFIIRKGCLHGLSLTFLSLFLCLSVFVPVILCPSTHVSFSHSLFSIPRPLEFAEPASLGRGCVCRLGLACQDKTHALRQHILLHFGITNAHTNHVILSSSSPLFLIEKHFIF